MKTIGVLTKDFSLYHDIVKALKRRKISYVSLTSPTDIPRQIGVLLTSKEELAAISYRKTIAVDDQDSLDYAVDLALQKLTGKELYLKVSVGIDPGERPGVAVVGDDILLQKKCVGEPSHVVSEIRRIQKMYPAKDLVIRIGHGSVIIRNQIINSLIPLKIPIEIVDEARTTLPQTGRCERDQKAAAAIALLTGGRVQTTLPLEPTRGAVRNVQRRSRQLTEGRYTISEDCALKVLRGELSLIEAIETAR
jgi:hypothetical protein